MKIAGSDFRFSKTVHLQYLLHVPEQVQKSSGEKWPTILFLHGLGESETIHPLFCEQASPRYVTERADFPLHCSRAAVSVECLVAELADCLDQLLFHCATTLPIDQQRLYLTGLSMGGYGCCAGGALADALCRDCADLGGIDVSWFSEKGRKVEKYAYLGLSWRQR